MRCWPQLRLGGYGEGGRDWHWAPREQARIPPCAVLHSHRATRSTKETNTQRGGPRKVDFDVLFRPGQLRSRLDAVFAQPAGASTVAFDVRISNPGWYSPSAGIFCSSFPAQASWKENGRKVSNWLRMIMQPAAINRRPRSAQPLGIANPSARRDEATPAVIFFS
ncbi:MAG: hypothetical protein IPL01_11200 [Acidobacteria bacterium]|nr:hypothetical protein [Acidobacteriota bacterium]